MSFWSFLVRLFRRPSPPPPEPPAVRLRPMAVYSVPDARVRLQAPDLPLADLVSRADSHGRAPFPEVPESVRVVNIFIEAPGYLWYGKVHQIGGGPQDIFIALTRVSLPPIVVDGLVFRVGGA